MSAHRHAAMTYAPIFVCVDVCVDVCRYLYAAALAGCTLLCTLTVHQFWYQGIRVGVHLKTVIGTEVRAFPCIP